MGIFSTLKPVSHLLTGGFWSVFSKFCFSLEDSGLSDQKRAFLLRPCLAYLWLHYICLLISSKLGHLLSPFPHSGMRTRHVEEELGHLGVHCCIWLSGVKKPRFLEVSVFCHFQDGEKIHLECLCPPLIAKPWAVFSVALLRLVTALRRDNFTMTYLLIISGTVSGGCAQRLCFFRPGTLSNGRLAEQMRGLAWFTGQAEWSRVQASPGLLSSQAPSSAPPPLPVSPSGNHEPHGFQAQILRFQMFGKFLCLGHSSRVREFNLGGRAAETLPLKRTYIRGGSILSPSQLQTLTQCLISEKISRFPHGRKQNRKNKISTHGNLFFSLLR